MKPKIAFYWCASCGGCEEAVLDLDEAILDVVAAVDIAFWPVALDFKRQDLERLEDGALAAAFVNGAVRTAEQEEMARLVRSKAQVLIAFGSCAHLGGIPGLANLSKRDAILSTAFPDGGGPQPGEQFYDTVLPLDRVIPVDYYLPGCPPTPNIIKAAVEALLKGQLPDRGSVLAPDRALCESCPRRDSRPVDLSVTAFRRTFETAADPDRCLLAQGFLCLGAATRGGCEARCINGNMPCTGCFGPVSRVRDFGGKALSAIASVAAGPEAVDTIPDPAGLFYRYSLPASRLQSKRTEVSHVATHSN